MYYLVVIAAVLTAAFAQMMLKKSACAEHSSMIREYLNPWVIGGYALMGISLLVNIFAISRGVQVKEVSIIESLSYLFVPVLSWLFFGEKVTTRKACSILLILVGIFVFFQ